jgi:nicotinate-nucleotide--dimethylbenzimidazole phosphoribosyltransferase
MSFAIKKITNEFDEHIQTTLDGKTKPLGALGQLENTAKIIARVQYSSLNSIAPSLKLNKPSLLIFAGDHGVAAEGVSIAPSEVTSQMVANFAAGGAAINVFCKQLGWQLSVVDTGILSPPESYLGVIDQRLGTITEPLNVSPAMSEAQVELGFEKATTLIKKMHKSGCNLIAFGEMGIGNTTSASAIMSAVMNITAQESVGRGTGVSDEVIKRKQQVIEQALTLNKNVKDYMIFAHCSGEQGHQSMLDYLQVKPLLNLGLRLGEGTGAALALPLIQASAAFYNDMASFAQADVTNVTDIKTSGVDH